MPKKSQFQNLVLQQTLQDYAQQPTAIQPAITLPIQPEALVPLPLAQSLFLQTRSIKAGRATTGRTSDEMLPFVSGAHVAVDTPIPSGGLLPPIDPPARSLRKKQLLRGTAIALSALLILAIYLTWHSTTSTAASPTITQQTPTSLLNVPSPQPDNSAADSTASGSANATIQVYIVGAIKHPGVYTLPANARVYQLIQAAGGTQPNADLVSINLAAKLTDGQEIYVLSVGEIAPETAVKPPGTVTSSTPMPAGSLVNINTATETQMEQTLHVSAATAKKIVDYRTQHGTYTSVDQLLQVVSQSIYNRIKGMVTT